MVSGNCQLVRTEAHVVGRIGWLVTEGFFGAVLTSLPSQRNSLLL